MRFPALRQICNGRLQALQLVAVREQFYRELCEQLAGKVLDVYD
jgi:hypothetical protein